MACWETVALARRKGEFCLRCCPMWPCPCWTSISPRCRAGPRATTVEWAKRKRQGLANYHLIRYADDWLLLVAGTREHAIGARDQAATVLAPMGPRLSEEKTKTTHIDEGVDFLG